MKYVKYVMYACVKNLHLSVFQAMYNYPRSLINVWGPNEIILLSVRGNVDNQCSPSASDTTCNQFIYNAVNDTLARDLINTLQKGGEYMIL